MAFFLSFFLSFAPEARVLVNNPLGPVRKVFSIQDVCKRLGVQDLLLVGSLGISTIDCMGREFSVGHFCKNIVKLKNFTRGFVRADNQVVCEGAQSIHLSVKLDDKKKKAFRNKKQGCQMLGEHFANSLTLFHASFSGPSAQEFRSQINCIFTAKNDDLSAKIEPILEFSKKY